MTGDADKPHGKPSDGPANAFSTSGQMPHPEQDHPAVDASREAAGDDVAEKNAHKDAHKK